VALACTPPPSAARAAVGPRPGRAPTAPRQAEQAAGGLQAKATAATNSARPASRPGGEPLEAPMALACTPPPSAARAAVGPRPGRAPTAPRQAETPADGVQAKATAATTFPRAALRPGGETLEAPVALACTPPPSAARAAVGPHPGRVPTAPRRAEEAAGGLQAKATAATTSARPARRPGGERNFAIAPTSPRSHH